MKFHSLLSIISLLGVSLRIHIQAEECASDNDSLDMTFGISITDNKIYQFIRYSRVLVYEGDLENFWLNGSLYLRDGDPRPLQMINLYLQPEVLEQLDSIIDNFYLDHAAISMVIRNTTKMTLDYHYRRREDIRFGFYHQWPLSLMEDPSEFYSYETTKFNRSYSEFPKKPHMFVNLTEMEGTVRFYARMVGKFGDNYYSKQKILISGSEYNYVIAINSKKIIVFRGLFLYTVQKEMGIICMSMFADELILSTDCDMSDPVQTKLLRLFDSIDYGFAYRNVLYLVSRRRRIVLSFDETLLRKLNVLRPFKVMKFEEFFYCPPSPTTKITTKKIKTTKKISPIDKEIKKIDTDVQNRTINIENRMTESSENFIPMIESEEKDLIDETATSIDDVKEKSSESASDQSRRFCGSDRAILDTTIGFAIANEKIYQFLHFCSILVYDPPLKQYWRGKAMILEGGQLNTLQSISPFMLEDLVYDCQNITSNLDSKISIALSARSKTKISLDYHSLNNEKMVMGFYDQWQSLHDFGEIYMNQSENFTRRIQHPKMTFSLTSQDEILRFYAYWKAEYYSNYFSRSKILISGSEHNYVLVKTVTEVMLYSGTFKFAMESPKGELCLNENQEIYTAFNCETNFSSRNQLLSLLSFAEFGFTHQNVVFLVAKQINRVLIFSEKAFQSFNQMKPVSSIKMDEFFICEDPNKKIRDGSNKAINKAKPTTKTIVKTRLTSKPSTTKSTTFTTPMITKSTTRFLTESSRKSSSKLTVKPTTITTTPTSTSPPPITSITTHTEIKKPITMPSGLKRPRTKPIERIKLVISMATKRANVTHKTTQRSTTILSKSKTDSMELEYDTSTEIDDETIEMNWINSIRKFFSRLIPKNQFGSIILAINGLFLLIALIEIMILCCACCRKRQRKQSKRRKILISSSEIPSNTL